MTDYNDDCPLASIVVTEDNCKNAATELGSEYKGSDRWVEAPAGCWQNGAKNWVFLNTITNPSLTRPNLGLRGICHDKGTEYMVILHLYFSHFFLRICSLDI